MKKVDLHFHSNYSDGELGLEALVQLAADNQVELMSLTDHDSVAGYPDFINLAGEKGIRVLCGIECSVTWMSQELHIIGLGVDYSHDSLLSYLAVQKAQRLVRAKNIALKLEKIGFEHCFDKVCELATHENISRTHFAKLLVEHYRVKDLRTAFKNYLGSNGAAYERSQWLNMQETIAVILNSGGVAILAHPLHYSLSTGQLKGLVKAFKEHKGTALEVVTGYQQQKDINKLANLCHIFNLQASTGSDFHKPTAFKSSLGQQSQLPDNLKPVWQELTSQC